MTPVEYPTVLVAFHEEVLGGATLSVLRVMPLLEQRGWRFLCWAATPSTLSEELARRGLEAYGLPRPIAYALRSARSPPGARQRVASGPRYLRGLHQLIRERQPALVHANSLFALAEAVAARSAGATVLLHVHELVPGGPKARVARTTARGVARERVAVSQASAATLKGAATRIVFEGVPIPREAAPIRRNPRPFVVGTVGVISKRKGSDVFVGAARRVLSEVDHIRFRMVGASRDPINRTWGDRVLQQAHAAGVEHLESTHVSRELRGLDAFVLPSRVDPFPLAMLEAMAAGLPVIGTRVGGIPEQVAPGCGLLVAPDDTGALAAAILRVASMPWTERVEMGVAARRRVAERFSLERQAAGLDAAYRSLTARTAISSS